MIKISYKDNQNWVDSDFRVTSWESLSEMYKNGRIQSSYIAPEIITDSWNGKIIDVQHIRWEVFELELFIKDSEINELSKIQSTSTIIIRDTINNISHEVKNYRTELLLFSEPERIFDTTNWKVVIRYRINKTIINKGVVYIDKINELKTIFDNGIALETNYFYTDFDIINFQHDTEIEGFNNENGVNETTKTISKNSDRVLFYMAIGNANILKEQFEKAQTITLNGVNVLENSKIEYTPIGEGLIKLVVDCLKTASISYPKNV